MVECLRQPRGIVTIRWSTVDVDVGVVSVMRREPGVGVLEEVTEVIGVERRIIPALREGAARTSSMDL